VTCMLLVCSQERCWLAVSESDMHRVRDESADDGGVVRARSCSQWYYTDMLFFLRASIIRLERLI